MDIFRALFLGHKSNSDFFLHQAEPGKSLIQTVIDLQSDPEYTSLGKLSDTDIARFTLPKPRQYVTVEDRIERDLETYLLQQNGRDDWLGYMAPPGSEVREPWEEVEVPANSFTGVELSVREQTDIDAINRPIWPFWSGDKLLFTRRYLKRRFWELFYTSYNKIPYFYTRATDYNEDGELDRSRKDYWEDLDFHPPVKTQRNSRHYEDTLHDLFSGCYLYRNYMYQSGTKYRYRLVTRRLFPKWRMSDIHGIRERYTHYDYNLDGYVSFEDMCNLLDDFGDETEEDIRRAYFNSFLLSDDGPEDMIDFEEFLRVLYTLTIEEVDPDWEAFLNPKKKIVKPVDDDLWDNYRHVEGHLTEIAANSFADNYFCASF